MKGTTPLSSNQPLTSGGRIEYIDAMRGFTMILVVLQHVASFCWHVYGNAPSVHEYLVQFRMPMFFFISGFVLFKAGVTWDLQQVVRFFKKKIPYFPKRSRDFNRLVCNGCYNDPRATWKKNVCPRRENRPEEEFLCSKKITPRMVIQAIDRLIADKKAGRIKHA